MATRDELLDAIGQDGEVFLAEGKLYTKHEDKLHIVVVDQNGKAIEELLGEGVDLDGMEKDSLVHAGKITDLEDGKLAVLNIHSVASPDKAVAEIGVLCAAGEGYEIKPLLKIQKGNSAHTEYQVDQLSALGIKDQTALAAVQKAFAGELDALQPTAEKEEKAQPEFNKVKVFAGGAAALTLVGIAYKAVAKMFGQGGEGGPAQENRGAGLLAAVTTGLAAFLGLSYAGQVAKGGENSKAFNLKDLFVNGVEHIKALAATTAPKGHEQA